MRGTVLHEIFIDLKNVYDALDRSRCLGILDGYGVGHRALRLLRRYWNRLKMVARAGGLLRRTLPWRERGHPWRPTVAHHFQFGGVRGGLPLGIPGVGTGGGIQKQ